MKPSEGALHFGQVVQRAMHPVPPGVVADAPAVISGGAGPFF